MNYFLSLHRFLTILYEILPKTPRIGLHFHWNGPVCSLASAWFHVCEQTDDGTPGIDNRGHRPLRLDAQAAEQVLVRSRRSPSVLRPASRHAG